MSLFVGMEGEMPLGYLNADVQWAAACQGLRLKGEIEQEMKFCESSTCR